MTALISLRKAAALFCVAFAAWQGAAQAAPTKVADLSKPAPGERRVALVIGNAAYRVGALKNPVNDAQTIGASLQAVGFEVISRENATFRELIEAMRTFSQRAQTADVRLVYYAGHGLQVKGRNYLLPVDADIQTEDDIPSKSADVNELLDRLGRIKNGVNIVILDACRNNPFAAGEVIGKDGRRMRFRGLTPAGLAAVDAPLGTMVAFSTAPGGVAMDNPQDKNSVYARYLATQLQTPGLPVELMFKQVRVNVAKATSQQQVPWESSSLMGEFCFKPNAEGGCGATSGKTGM